MGDVLFSIIYGFYIYIINMNKSIDLFGRNHLSCHNSKEEFIWQM